MQVYLKSRGKKNNERLLHMQKQKVSKFTEFVTNNTLANFNILIDEIMK